MSRSSMPDAREQEAAYRETAEALGGRPLVIRTLDAGADKPLPTSTSLRSRTRSSASAGSDSGWSGPMLLQTQLTAILHVAADHPLRVMFPMVATIDELRAANDRCSIAPANGRRRSKWA